ncbi:MAG: phospho-sugar mutase [Acholeplasmatales bacterium]|jgi:phosphoglucomutase|nr:phospho-sugar mutase [Acholeplasmatales bacterium]
MEQYEKNYQTWKKALLPEYLKKQLEAYTKEEIKEAFTGEVEFGTGGLRGIRGPGSARMNIFNIKKVTLGYANYLLETFPSKKISIVASYDNRHYSKEFAIEACKVLEEKGIKTYIFAQLTPTPILSFAVRHLHCNGGIMLTASHNPKEYNGYKLYNNEGAQLNLTQSEACVKKINEIKDIFNIAVSKEEPQLVKPSLFKAYFKLVKTVKINRVKKNIKVVYSPLHGTGSPIIPPFLIQEGYDIYPLESQMKIDPDFSSTLSSNPEDPKSFIEALKYAKEIQADLIILTDPDADRLGFAYKNSQEEWVLVNGNQTASLLLHYKITENYKKGRYFKNGVVFTTNVTTDLVKVIAQAYKLKVVTCLTGFKNIAGGISQMNKHEKFVFGCEESYGSILDSFVRDKDSIQASLLLCEIVAYLKNNHLLISDYLEQIYSSFGYYYEYTHNYVKPGLDGKEVIAKIMKDIRKSGLNIDLGAKLIAFDDCSLDKHFDFLKNVETPLHLEWSNVLKYYYDNGLFIVLRPSGTEPKLKVYFSYADKTSMEKSQIYVDECFKKLNLIIERY